MSTSSAQNSDKLLNFLNLGTDFLSKHDIFNARLNAERLLCHLLGLQRMELYLNFDRPISSNEKNEYRELLKRRSKAEPLQYITNETEFYGNKFFVAPGVLIPRPETEELIENIQKSKPENGFRNALDIGCGSGIIGITLLSEKIAESVTAVDVSRDALNITHRNFNSILNEEDTLEEGRTESGVCFKNKENGSQYFSLVKADAFNDSFHPETSPYDLVVSNPPYVTEEEWKGLDQEVKDFEPKLALTSGNDGLDAHRFLAAHLKNLLDENGVFFGEFGAYQGENIQNIYEEHFEKVEIIKDLSGKERIIFARQLR